MIKVVLFDVDGVLINSFEANLKFFQDLMIAVGKEPPSREKYGDMFHLNLVSVVKALAKPDSEEEFNKIYQMAHSRDVDYDTSLISIPDNTEKVLENLSNKYILGIVTSRIRNSVYEVPDLNRLKHYFKTSVAYEDTEKHKPNPEPLLLAMEQLEVKPEETVYIGDALTDVEAAKAAGVKIISYPRELKDVDAYTDSFIELPEIIERF